MIKRSKAPYAFLLVFFFLAQAAGAQNYGDITFNRLGRTVNHAFKGFEASTSWYDIPVAIAYMYRADIRDSDLRDKILFLPPSFEREFADDYGSPNHFSLGSMDKDMLPYGIFYGRLALNVASDIFTPGGSSVNAYRDVFLFKKSLIYTYTLTEYVKSFVKRTRPDGSDNRSFFSGHTSTTFSAATFLYLESKELFDNWDYLNNREFLASALTVTSFSVLHGWASYVGYCRIRDNKHYISDVITGAVVGSFISYMVFNKMRDESGIISHFNLGVIQDGLALQFKHDL